VRPVPPAAGARARPRLRGRLLIPLEEILLAQATIASAALRTPLVRLDAPESPAEIWLKLENLQPIGSFKIRGAANAIRQARPEELRDGVVTASAGNMAQGVAWAAREAGVPATIVVPDYAPATKLAAIERLGGRVIKVPFEEWWQAIEEARFDGAEGLFVHPVYDSRVMAGNGTIGLELVDDLEDFDTVLIPWGGGGLTVGIASAVKALRPEVRILPVEPETGAPLAATLAAGSPQGVEYTASFVDGSGSRALLPAMWAAAQGLLDGSHVASLAETAAAVRLLAERARVVAEGAGALAVAAAMSGDAGDGRIVCIVSGGNIDAEKLATILAGGVP
jgi:threonine dehydratase